MNPFFSIVIPTYNSVDKLLQAIQSISSQNFQNFELIVVDDGSTDNTQNVVENMNLRYIRKKNGGPASARNLGIREAKGEYICLLDADDRFMEEKLSLFFTACQSGAVFIYSDALYIDEKNKKEYLFSARVAFCTGFCWKELMKNNFIVASTVAIKKEIFEEVGFFDEKKELKFVEDYDLWLKIAKKYPLYYIDTPLTKYYIHQQNNSRNTKRTLYSLIFIYKKWALNSFIALKQLVKYIIVYFLYFGRIIREDSHNN
jgi:glycosyltransferase involved in cell wall biosynthesis